jgi:hypothetical protein
LALGSAQAFNCAPTESSECRLELSTMTIVFDSGIYNFNGDTQTQGNDAYAQGFSTGAGDFPELTAIDTDNGRQVGFSFAPQMLAQVGGSGFDGYHEAYASFGFYGLQFIARPGWRVDAVRFTVSGSRSRVGNGYVGLAVPGIPHFDNDQFVASHRFAPAAADYEAYFIANAQYQEGPDGTALAYGTAAVSFDFASLVAQVSAVPEPGSAALALLGGLALAGRLRGHRRA